MSFDRGIRQLFPSPAIARRLAPFAIPGRRMDGKAGETPEIAEIAQCALQPFRRPLQVTKFAGTMHTGAVCVSASSM